MAESLQANCQENERLKPGVKKRLLIADYRESADNIVRP